MLRWLCCLSVLHKTCVQVLVVSNPFVKTEFGPSQRISFRTRMFDGHMYGSELVCEVITHGCVVYVSLTLCVK